MKARIPQFDLPVLGQEFNLYSETALDGARAIAEITAENQRTCEAAAFQERMQRQLAECPGFVGCYPPSSPGTAGSVTLQPSAIDDAVDWLKRRFAVGQVQYKRGLGFSVEIAPRARGKGGRRVRCSFARPEQFEMTFTEGQTD